MAFALPFLVISQRLKSVLSRVCLKHIVIEGLFSKKIYRK
jgi:hypothetical protein